MTFSTISQNNMMELDINQPSIVKVVGKGKTTTFKTM